MEMTSSEANKLLRKLRDERDDLLARERQEWTFVAATVENPEEVRPDYDYAAVQGQLAHLESEMLRLKHAINCFNVTQEVPGTGMTIDQVLIRIPQLTERKRRLAEMRSIPKKSRNTLGRSTNFIEYTYASFDPVEAEKDYLAVTDELAELQTALDLVNSTVSFQTGIEK